MFISKGYTYRNRKPEIQNIIRIFSSPCEREINFLVLIIILVILDIGSYNTGNKNTKNL